MCDRDVLDTRPSSFRQVLFTCQAGQPAVARRASKIGYLKLFKWFPMVSIFSMSSAVIAMVFRALLEMGASVNVLSKRGRTPLMARASHLNSLSTVGHE